MVTPNLHRDPRRKLCTFYNVYNLTYADPTLYFTDHQPVLVVRFQKLEACGSH